MRRSNTTPLNVIPILTALAVLAAPAHSAGPWDKFKKKVHEVKEVKDALDTITDSESEEESEKGSGSSETSGESTESGSVATGTGAISTVVIGSLAGIEKPALGASSYPSKDHLFNAQGTKLMRLVAQGSRVRVVCDGVESDPYSSVQGMCFSPDGSSWGYVGLTSSKAHVVVNGEVRLEIDLDTQTLARIPDDTLYTSSKQATQMQTKQNLNARWILFSNDGSRFSCITAAPSEHHANMSVGGLKAHASGPYTVVLDGEPIAEVSGVGMMHFTPSGRHIFTSGGSYAKSNSSRAVYIDGVPGPEIKEASILGLGVDASGEKLVYTTRHTSSASPTSAQLYIDNVPMVDPARLPEGATIHDVSADDTLTTVAVVVELPGDDASQSSYAKTYGLVVNGELVGKLLRPDSYILGHDGNYVLHDPDRFVVVNGDKQLDYKELQAAGFSRDSSAYRFAVSTQLGTFIADEKQNETGPIKGEVSEIRFSPDAKHVAMRTYDGLVIDGQEVVPSNIIKHTKGIPIDPDWTTITLRHQQSVSDSVHQAAGRVGLGIQTLKSSQFNVAHSADGRHTAVLRQNHNYQTKERHYELYVNDQLVGGRFDQVGYTHFDDSGTLRFVASQGDTIMSCAYTP